mmetsp:Transcript_5080/g.10250  ORF Transcript_5080/g.10250 Transcript_5080/m.10250 type:complete len:261 (+) Transcript_5080:1394-2176(+)
MSVVKRIARMPCIFPTYLVQKCKQQPGSVRTYVGNPGTFFVELHEQRQNHVALDIAQFAFVEHAKGVLDILSVSNLQHPFVLDGLLRVRFVHHGQNHVQQEVKRDDHERDEKNAGQPRAAVRRHHHVGKIRRGDHDPQRPRRLHDRREMHPPLRLRVVKRRRPHPREEEHHREQQPQEAPHPRQEPADGGQLPHRPVRVGREGADPQEQGEGQAPRRRPAEETGRRQARHAEALEHAASPESGPGVVEGPRRAVAEEPQE